MRPAALGRAVPSLSLVHHGHQSPVGDVLAGVVMVIVLAVIVVKRRG
jgi:hypothetical protein